MSVYDFVILAVILVSGVIGFFRGGAREVITLCSIVAAVVVDGLLAGFTEPFARKFITPPLVADAVAVVLVFVIVYMAVHWLGSAVGKKLHQNEETNTLDRTAGAGFGLVRGLVLIGITHLFMVVATPQNRLPTWFSHASLYPVSAFSAKTIQLVLPRAAKAADVLAPRVERQVRDGATDPKATAKPAAYDQRQRDSMDALVEKSR
jgi:membrane protein required for colicin V production